MKHLSASNEPKSELTRYIVGNSDADQAPAFPASTWHLLAIQREQHQEVRTKAEATGQFWRSISLHDFSKEAL
jgi:hypothetical protein